MPDQPRAGKRRWWHRRPPTRQNGTIVYDATVEHRCEPPGADEWPAGDWKVVQTKKYPDGTVWRCDCGRAWRSGRFEPGPFVSLRYSSKSHGMWLNWYRYYDLDVVNDESCDDEATASVDVGPDHG